MCERAAGSPDLRDGGQHFRSMGTRGDSDRRREGRLREVGYQSVCKLLVLGTWPSRGEKESEVI